MQATQQTVGAMKKAVQRELLARGMKHCWKCSQDKLLAEFNKQTKGVGGRCTWCRDCYRARDRQALATEKSERSDGFIERAPRRKHQARFQMGERVGRLEILEYALGARQSHWKCRCDCGTEFWTRQADLSSGRRISCYGSKCPMHESSNVIPGRIFSRWTALKFLSVQETGKNRRWLCTCMCGVKRVVDEFSLTNGRSLSCGCLARERTRAALTKYSKDHRECAICNVDLLASEFRTIRDTGRLHSYCVSCERQRDSTHIEQLRTRYIRRLLHLRENNCPPALIELKREHLRLARYLKEKMK